LKGTIKIRFVKINGVNVDEKMLSSNPRLMEVTKDTLQKFCETTKKYFADNKIKITTDFELEK
jgi:hypothetical protein